MSEMADVDTVFDRIVAHQGERSTLARGGTFSYRVIGRHTVSLDRTNQKLSRDTFKQAIERCPLVTTTQLQDLRGPSYLFAILTDPRIDGCGGKRDSNTSESPFSAAESVLHPRRRTAQDLRARIEDVKAHFAEYLDIFDSSGPFQPRQLEIHRSVIRRRREFGSVAAAIANAEFIRDLHLVLGTWQLGMRGSRLLDVNRFQASLHEASEELESLDGLLISEIDESIIARIWQLISTISIVDNKSKIVAGTKALHHLLPDLVVPIDRRWTGQFFGWYQFDSQPAQVFSWAYKVFIEIAHHVRPQNYVGEGWRTSPSKVIDNAIIGYCRAQSQPAPQVSFCVVKGCSSPAVIRQPLLLGKSLVAHVPLCSVHSANWEQFSARQRRSRKDNASAQRDEAWLLDAALAMTVNDDPF